MSEININSKTVETEKIFYPETNLVLEVTYDKRHRPKIKAFTGC